MKKKPKKKKADININVKYSDSTFNPVLPASPEYIKSQTEVILTILLGFFFFWIGIAAQCFIGWTLILDLDYPVWKFVLGTVFSSLIILNIGKLQSFLLTKSIMKYRQYENKNK